jgi:hypothetical protein
MLMPKRLIVAIFCLTFISSFAQIDQDERVQVKGNIKGRDLKPVSYAHILVRARNEGWVGDYYGKFKIAVFPGDTLIISAISFLHAVVPITSLASSPDFSMDVILQPDTVYLKELIVHPYPSSYKQLKEEFMKVEIDDPISDLDLHLPSPQELKLLAADPSYEPGQIRIYSGPGPISLLYDQFSKEGRSKNTYAELIKKEKADKRYNKALVTRLTGLKNEDDVKNFMDFCALQIRFILESTDYELYAAIMDCYGEYCRSDGRPTNAVE